MKARNAKKTQKHADMLGKMSYWCRNNDILEMKYWLNFVDV